jgi:hypothetical protein
MSADLLSAARERLQMGNPNDNNCFLENSEMSTLRMLSMCLAMCLVATMGSPVMAELVNGNFESVTAGKFDGWEAKDKISNPTYTAYTVATSPMNIAGTNSARIISYGKSTGDSASAGTMWQKFDVAGLADFKIDCDLAFLDVGTTSDREFSLLTYAADGTTIVDNVAVYRANSNPNSTHILEYNGTTAGSTTQSWLYNSINWQFGNVTTNVNVAKTFDGETPAVNHLTMLGSGYGTANYSLKITFNDVNWTLTNHLRAATNNDKAISYIAFFGRSGTIDGDFLVDNVTVTPEPGSIVLVVTGLIGLLCYGWRRQK